MVRRKPSQIKQKYHEKTLTDEAIRITWIRLLDVEPLFSDYVWLQITPFDLTQLGMGLLADIAPIDFEPLTIDFTYETPTTEEMEQGIWMKFEPLDFTRLYAWMLDLDTYIYENFILEILITLGTRRLQKAIYGKTKYGIGYYDPVQLREFLRSTFYKLRLLRTPDISWKKGLEIIRDVVGAVRGIDEHVYNRLVLMLSAQKFSFVLGMGVLGYSFLTEKEGDLGKIPFIDARGNEMEVKFKNLEHLQIGFILGVTPLGYGVLLPMKCIYKMKDGKKNPVAIQAVIDKARRISRRVTLTTWAYSNYNRPDEMTYYHKSERVAQYDTLQWQRRMIEMWVESQIPPEEANPMKLRQYKNAVLQFYAWKAKRHRWGFNAWKRMTDEEFKEWWLGNWEAQGLNRQVLEKLYEGFKRWLPRLREEKLKVGEKLKELRKRLALSR